MNTQQVFDKIVKGLASQGWRKSVDENMDCKYRYEGLKCAAGWLIPDELYKPEIEGCRFSVLISQNALTAADLGITSQRDLGLICRCQEAHDFSRGGDDMVDRFQRIADTFKLKFSEQLP